MCREMYNHNYCVQVKLWDLRQSTPNWITVSQNCRRSVTYLQETKDIYSCIKYRSHEALKFSSVMVK